MPESDLLPSTVVHADWSSNRSKRWMAQATLEDGRYVAHPPEPVKDPSTLLERLRANPESVLLAGFDFPIGVPVHYANQVGVEDFLSLLPQLGEGEWAGFYAVAERPEEIGVRRPFYPQRPGGAALHHLLDALGAESADNLLRRCDRGYPGRPAAAPLFWTMGPRQVGKAAISGWRDLLGPALRSPTLDLAIWPFDGELRELLEPGRTVVVETYPAEFYRHLGIRVRSKREQENRRANAPALLRWAQEAAVDLPPTMRAALLDGFGSSKSGEDLFDAAVGLFGMLNVALGRRPPGEATDGTVRRVEGWMLGQSIGHAGETEPPTRKEAPAEYDALADLYDLEYTHRHDALLWLALAEREGGPVVEWGSGTGRLAVPLAEAGFAVAAVEISERMVERGRRKGTAVEWVCGDMRGASLGRRFRLAVCAFNSFLCLTNVEDALAFLRNAREHLEPGGLLGIEVSSFSPEELAVEPGGAQTRHDFTRKLPGGGRLDRLSVSRYDAASQLLEMRLFYERYGADGALQEKRAHDLAIRVAGRGELELMLRLAGFEVEAVYGGFGGEPFAADSDHLIVLARRPRAPLRAPAPGSSQAGASG